MFTASDLLFAQVVTLMFSALALVLAVTSLLLRLFSSRGSWFSCDSCREKWAYDSGESNVIQSMVSHGWLALPGGVQYCPACRKEVEKRIATQHGEPLLEPLKPDVSDNPYAVTIR